MSLPGSYQLVINALGITIDGSTSKAATLGIDPVNMPLAAGNAGALYRTDADTGTIVLSDGHTLEEADTVDVYWATGIRYGMTANTSTSDTIYVVDGGAGDDLPSTAGIACVVCTQESLDITFDGDNVILIGASTTKRCKVVFLDVANVLLAQEIATDGAWGWADGMGTTNPLTGNAVTSVTVSNGIATAGTFKMTGLQYEA